MGFTMKEEKIKTKGHIIFDDQNLPQLKLPLSDNRVIELENTLGKAILDRFNFELKNGNFAKKK